MWWWQSHALAGALSLGASVPSDHLTCWAAASLAAAPIMPAAAPADIVISNSRRPQKVAAMASSLGYIKLVYKAGLAWHRRTSEAMAQSAAIAITLIGARAIAPKRTANQNGYG